MYYSNGSYLADNTLTIPVTDRGLLLADGLFETVYIKNRTPLFLADHYSRMLDAASVIKIPFDLTLPELEKIAVRLIDENFSDDEDEGSLRITHTRGSGPRGIGIPAEVSPTLFVTVSPSHGVHADNPLSLYVSTIWRNESSPLSRIKSLAYLDNILARDEAVQNGATEAVMLNAKGEVACITIGNIFIVDSHGEILTPPLKAGILPGITRRQVIDLCRKNDISIQEKSLSLNDLENAAEIFVTNSIMGVRKAYLFGCSPADKQSYGVSDIITKLYKNFSSDVLQNGSASK